MCTALSETITKYWGKMKDQQRSWYQQYIKEKAVTKEQCKVCLDLKNTLKPFKDKKSEYDKNKKKKGVETEKERHMRLANDSEVRRIEKQYDMHIRSDVHAGNYIISVYCVYRLLTTINAVRCDYNLLQEMKDGGPQVLYQRRSP